MPDKYISYQDLCIQKNGSIIIYEDLLNTKEWQEKRQFIIKRDEFYCTRCGLSDTTRHEQFLVAFDKNKRIDIVINNEHIIADYPFNSDKPIYLHVHHNFYIIQKLPWEYDDNDLITLCNWCHWELHQHEIIPIYEESESGLVKLQYTPCKRCNGAGVFPEFRHIQYGTCFRCKGVRYEELIH